jgi:hypothetical protein
VSVSSFLLPCSSIPYFCSSRSCSSEAFEGEGDIGDGDDQTKMNSELRRGLINSGQQPYMNGNGGGMMAQPTGFY